LITLIKVDVHRARHRHNADQTASRVPNDDRRSNRARLAESLVKTDPGSSRKTGSVIRLDGRWPSDTTGWN
jgi:hypothetical protein